MCFSETPPRVSEMHAYRMTQIGATLPRPVSSSQLQIYSGSRKIFDKGPKLAVSVTLYPINNAFVYIFLLYLLGIVKFREDRQYVSFQI